MNSARDDFSLNSGAEVASGIDPITVEVIRRRLTAIADQVDLNITRTAFSPLVYEYKDYAVGVVDAMEVAMATGSRVNMVMMGAIAKAAIAGVCFA